MNKYIFIITSTVVLFISYGFNSFKTVTNNDRTNFEKYSESLIVGRLIISNKEGVLSHGGLTGVTLHY